MMLKKYIPAEKIETVTEEEEDSQAGKQPEERIESPFVILDSSGINTARGLANCGGDDEFYHTILLEYLRGADEKKEDLEKFLAAGDFQNYGILIHSLKSTSAMIGAEAPCKLAQALEAAAKDGNGDYVRSNHGAFLDQYDATLGAIKKAVPLEDGTEEYEIDADGIMEFFPEDE